MLTIACTGHRHSIISPDLQRDLITSYLARHDPDLAITGMALGFDQLVARTCDACGVPFLAALPCINQDALWSPTQRGHYKWLLSRAKEVILVANEPYRPALMQLRNEWMVNRADRILALFSGKPSGTANTLRYAQAQRKPIDNIWPTNAQG